MERKLLTCTQMLYSFIACIAGIFLFSTFSDRSDKCHWLIAILIFMAGTLLRFSNQSKQSDAFIWSSSAEKNRLTLFPIQYDELWNYYKMLEGLLWTAQEVDLSQDRI